MEVGSGFEPLATNTVLSPKLYILSQSFNLLLAVSKTLTTDVSSINLLSETYVCGGRRPQVL